MNENKTWIDGHSPFQPVKEQHEFLQTIGSYFETVLLGI